MAFKKRLNSKIVDNTQVNITSEYGRKGKIKKACSIVINGLLMTSMILGGAIPKGNIYANNSELDKSDNTVVEENISIANDTINTNIESDNNTLEGVSEAKISDTIPTNEVNVSEVNNSEINTRSVAPASVVPTVENKSASTTDQSVGVITALAEPEAEDGMKLPNITLAKEGNMLMTGRGAYNQPSWNTISGNLYVKWGNPSVRPHSYGSKNQAEYDYVVNHVKNIIYKPDYRLDSNWVYLQRFIANGYKDFADSYIDPVLAKNGIDARYGDWKSTYKYIITGLRKGIMTVEDAEKLTVYLCAAGNVATNLSYHDPKDGSPYSAYDILVHKRGDCDANAQLQLIVADMLGLCGMIAGPEGHQELMLKVGNYWWQYATIPTFDANVNVYQTYPVITEAPTY